MSPARVEGELLIDASVYDDLVERVPLALMNFWVLRTCVKVASVISEYLGELDICSSFWSSRALKFLDVL